MHKKEFALEEAQQQSSLANQAMQDELMLLREQLKEKMQETNEFKQSMTDRDSASQKLKHELQMTQNEVQKLQNDLALAQQLSSVAADTTEADQLRLDLQTAQMNIQQLRNKSESELQAAQLIDHTKTRD